MTKSLHYLLMSNHLLFQKELISAIKDTDLTSGQPKVLDYLIHNNGAVQKDIAVACHIEPATLTSVLLGMENKGLITREMKNGNRRSLYVFLTEKGTALAGRVKKEFDIIETAAFNGFTDAEKQQLLIFLSRISDNIDLKGELLYD